MHELPIAEGLLNLALKHANQAGAVRVNRLHLVIGQMASIVDDSIQFYWDIISKDTIAEGATLEFERVPAVLRCWNCTTEFTPDGRDYLCPECNSARVKVIAGDDLRLESIDVDME